MTVIQADGSNIESMTLWFYEHSSDGFAISKGGAILQANRAWCDLLGITQQQAIGQTASEIVKPADLHIFAASDAEFRERGETKYRLRLNVSKPEDVWVEVSVKRGPDDHALIALRDISSRLKLAEEYEEVATIGALLRANAGAVSWQYSPLRETFFADAIRPANTTLLEPGATEIPLDQILKTFVLDETPEEFSRRLERSIESGEPDSIEFRSVAEDGRRECFRAFWRGLRPEEDGRWRLIGLTQDVTDLADARDQALTGQKLAKEADRVKSRFLANVSHEFRTPLNGVLGVLRLLKNEPVSATAGTLLDEGITCAEVLNAVLQDLVDLADLDTGRLALSLAVTDVPQLVESLVSLFRPEFDAKGLRMEADTPSAPMLVIVDPVRLRQILGSLIGNAAKFTLGGGVTIKASGFGRGDSHRLRFEVSDTGIGIAPEAMAELFTNFRQADDATTRGFSGIGMGLTLSRKLARLMGGDVGGTSELGRGSTFWVDIPAPMAEQAAELEDVAPFAGLRVLVVDDNPTNRLIATKILDHFGASTETASDGVIAVQTVQKTPFDLVLMDIQMPNMDGVEATSQIRALPSPVGQVPIAAMTANVSPEQIESYKAVGMNGLIAKPVSPSSVFNEITRLFTGGGSANVYRLTYHSRACAQVLCDPSSAIRDIVSVSQTHNSQHEITGALLFCDGRFVQTLEGPQQAVDALYENIKRDGRHEQVTLMRASLVEGRVFADWSMVGVEHTDMEISELLNTDAFEPAKLEESEMVLLLSSLVAVENLELLRGQSEESVANSG